MIEARGITQRFGDVAALDELSFEVQSGQVTGFLGPNDSGKSTTMSTIMGLDRPASLSSSTRTLNSSIGENFRGAARGDGTRK